MSIEQRRTPKKQHVRRRSLAYPFSLVAFVASDIGMCRRVSRRREDPHLERRTCRSRTIDASDGSLAGRTHGTRSVSHPERCRHQSDDTGWRHRYASVMLSASDVSSTPFSTGVRLRKWPYGSRRNSSQCGRAHRSSGERGTHAADESRTRRSYVYSTVSDWQRSVKRWDSARRCHFASPRSGRQSIDQ